MYEKFIKNFPFYFQKEKRKLLNLIPYVKKNTPRKIPKIGAYLSIYNDSDILGSTLASIKNYVDELVVVDGAYEWMAPYLLAIGKDPLRSDESTYALLDQSNIPYRVVSGAWKNEVEKRSAGYDAVNSRYVMRVDADEVIFFDDAVLSGFFQSGCALAEMYMPNYVAPGFVIQGGHLIDKFRTFPRQTCLFDKTKIAADEHLKYLWLVLTADKLPVKALTSKIYSVYEKPIAFCAHLTNWRSLKSSALRSSFYTMNWMRQNGVPWISGFSLGGIDNFDEFFTVIPHAVFFEIMKNGAIVQGDIQLRRGERLATSPLTLLQEANFSHLYKNFLKGLQDQVLSLVAKGGITLPNYPFYLDISNHEISRDFIDDGVIRIEFSEEIKDVRAELITLQESKPYSTTIKLSAIANKRTLEILVPYTPLSQCPLRRSIKIEISPEKDNLGVLYFNIVRHSR